jgi:hypothetical protein
MKATIGDAFDQMNYDLAEAALRASRGIKTYTVDAEILSGDLPEPVPSSLGVSPLKSVWQGKTVVSARNIDEALTLAARQVELRPEFAPKMTVRVSNAVPV